MCSGLEHLQHCSSASASHFISLPQCLQGRSSIAVVISKSLLVLRVAIMQHHISREDASQPEGNNVPLSNLEIRHELNAGSISITPFDNAMLQPASYDMNIGKVAATVSRNGDPRIDLEDEIDHTRLRARNAHFGHYRDTHLLDAVTKLGTCSYQPALYCVYQKAASTARRCNRAMSKTSNNRHSYAQRDEQ